MSDNLPVPVSPPATSNIDPHARWKFLRDVGVFQFKLFLNNMHNFFQIPLTLVVAAIDLIFKTDPEGARFYKLLEHGRTIDDAIDIYSVIAHREKAMNASFTVDNVISSVEGAIVREYQKGGTAASMKSAVDKVIDEMQARTDAGKDKVTEAMKQAADKVKEKMGGDRNSPPPLVGRSKNCAAIFGWGQSAVGRSSARCTSTPHPKLLRKFRPLHNKGEVGHFPSKPSSTLTVISPSAFRS